MFTTEELGTADEIAGQLVRLVRLIEREQARYQAEHPDAVDRATYLLLVHVATDEGRRVYAENRQLRNQRIAALVADWPVADRRAFVAQLARFTDAVERSRPRS